MVNGTKSAFVTGASGGVGRATVIRLVALGWRVFAGVRTVAAAEGIAEGRAEVIPVELDICDEASVARARDQIHRHLGEGGLAALVNNAGCTLDGPVELLSLAELRQQFEINVIGQIAVIQAVLPCLRMARGRIVNVGGAAGRLTLPMHGALSASKGALDSFSDALRMELKHQGVHVSYIEPGALRTDFFRKSIDRRLHDGWAGTSETQHLYTRAIESSTRALANSHASPVEHAVRAIVNALTTRRPAARYIVGREAAIGLRVLLRFPTGVRDRVMMSSLGLAKADFDVDAGGDGTRR